MKITGYAHEEALADYRRVHRPTLTKYAGREKEKERDRDKTHRTGWLARILESRKQRPAAPTGGIRLVTVMAPYALRYAQQSTTIICHLKKVNV